MSRYCCRYCKYRFILAILKPLRWYANGRILMDTIVDRIKKMLACFGSAYICTIKDEGYAIL